MNSYGISERDILVDLCEEYLNLFVRPSYDIDFETTEGTVNEYCASSFNTEYRTGFVEIGLNNLDEEKQMSNVVEDRGLSDLEFPLVDTHRVFSVFHEIGHIRDMDTFSESEMCHFQFEKMQLMFSDLPREEKERRYRMVENEKSADDYAEACLKNDTIREFVREFLENKKKARGL